jgi:hypothetical protein
VSRAGAPRSDPASQKVLRTRSTHQSCSRLFSLRISASLPWYHLRA